MERKPAKKKGSEQGTQQLSLLKTFLYYLKGSRASLILCFACMIAGSLVNFLIPQVTSATIDNILGDEPLEGIRLTIVNLLGGRDFLRDNLIIIGAIIVAMTFVIAVFAFFRRTLALDSSEKVGKRIRDTMYCHIQSLPFSWHSSHPTGDIIQRTTQDSDLIKRYISKQFLELFNVVILISVGLTLMYTMNVKMAALSTVFLVASLVFSVVYFARIAKWFMITEVEEGRMTSLLQENLTGLRVVRAFGQQAAEDSHYRKKNEDYTNLWIKVGKKLGIFWGSGDLFAGLLTFVVIIVGAYMVVAGNLTTGDLLVFIAYNSIIIWPIRNLGRMLAETGRVKVGLSRLREVLVAEPEKELDTEREIPIKGDIEFKNVSFSYDNSRKILKDISFSIKSGTVFGIIGGTGSGKSTLVQLINRLYDADSGEIFIDGENIKNIKRRHLRKHIGIVLQEPFLFSRKISENIMVAMDSESCFEDMEKYASIASIDSSIEEFTEGYETFVGEKGVTLSGGQKQRLAIARMLITKPSVVIFDDSLSAVDTDTDQKIRRAIAKNLKGTTVILISHRIASLMHADKILVLNNGEIESLGTHDELIAAGGTYKRLYDLQSGAVIEEANA